VVERTGRLVGRAVASVANLLDLPLACVAGSVALGYGEPFFTRSTRIVPAGLGSEGPLVGAAAVAWRALGHDIGVA
jgi:glucokinase